MSVRKFILAKENPPFRANEPEIDFPFDRLFRKIGVYLRCLMGAILIGATIQNPATCFSPGNENGRNEFVNSYCISLLKHPVRYTFQLSALA